VVVEADQTTVVADPPRASAWLTTTTSPSNYERDRRHRDDRFGRAETQVLWNRLQATADEMYDAAERLAYSFSIREGADASTAVMTADGDAIGLSDQSVPVLSGALSRTTRLILEDHFPPETLEPGDTIVTNDPWIGGGHLSDVVVLNPVFHNGTSSASSAVSDTRTTWGAPRRLVD